MAATDTATKKLKSQLSSHFDTAKELATIINEQLPEEKQLGVPAMDRSASITDNTSKLVQLIQSISDFVEELDQTLQENLSPEQYAMVTNEIATIEQILAVMETVTKGLVAIAGPIVATIAKKLKNSKVLQKLKENLKAAHSPSVVLGSHDSHIAKGSTGESHPRTNEHELGLGQDYFSTIAVPMVNWFIKKKSKGTSS